MILCRSVSLFLRKNTKIFTFLDHKKYFNTSIALSSKESYPKILTHDLVKNHTEWFVLKGYINYLSKSPKECKFERYVNILINIGDRIIQYNKKCGFFDYPTTKWEWNMGVLKQVPRTGSLNLIGDNFDPLDVMNILKIFSKLRLYHRINNNKFEIKQNKGVKHKFKMTTDVDHPLTSNIISDFNSSLNKSYNFFSDLIDDINPKSFKIIGSNFNYKTFGPLRFNGDGFIAYPMILSNPFLFELTDSNFPNWLENSINKEDKTNSTTNSTNSSENNTDNSSDNNNGITDINYKYKNIKKNFSYFIDTVMTQFLDQLLILVSNSDFSVSKLCVMSMYLSVMIYGPKLKRKDGCKIDTRVLNSLQNILNYTCEAVKMNKDNISLRSLAYLVNCSKPRFDLLSIVSQRIIESDRPIDADFLENFCFAFTKCYYKNDLLYYKLSSLVNQDTTTFTPIVTLNLILSFSRVNKLDLVQSSLFDRLLSFSEYDFKKFSPSLLNSLTKLTEDYPELSNLCFNKNNQQKEINTPVNTNN